MRPPEEVAREIRRLTWDVLGNDGLVEEDGPALADLIRARDAEMAEQVRAEALSEYHRFTSAIGFGDGITEPAAKQALSPQPEWTSGRSDD